MYSKMVKMVYFVSHILYHNKRESLVQCLIQDDTLHLVPDTFVGFLN